MKSMIKPKQIMEQFIQISPPLVAEKPLLNVPPTYNDTEAPSYYEQTTEEVTDRTYLKPREIRKLRQKKKTEGQKLFLDR
jgi:hypothetical protein